MKERDCCVTKRLLVWKKDRKKTVFVRERERDYVRMCGKETVRKRGQEAVRKRG